MVDSKEIAEESPKKAPVSAVVIRNTSTDGKEDWIPGRPSPLDHKSCKTRTLTHPDKKRFNSIMKANSAPLMACYKKGLANNIALRGRLKLRFIVRSDGTVQRCRVIQHVEDPAIGTCMCKAVLAITGFQGPPTGGCTNSFTWSVDLIGPT